MIDPGLDKITNAYKIPVYTKFCGEDALLFISEFSFNVQRPHFKCLLASLKKTHAFC